jgi:hypothetical protein
MMLLYLDKYDYIVWIDADAHFYLDAACLENVINAHPDVSLIFSGDLNQSKPWEINCGFMIVKSDTVSRRLLTMWAYDTMIKTKNTFPYWEQGVLWYMYMLNLGSIRAVSVIIPYGLLQHFYEHELVTFGHNKYTLTKKPFIHHNPGTFASDRYNSSKAYFDRHFAENI